MSAKQAEVEAAEKLNKPQEENNHNHQTQDQEDGSGDKLKESWKHPQVKHEREKIGLSCCLVLAFFLLGASFNLLGPSLVHLGYLYNANTAQMSFVFTFLSLGYLVGSILSGTVFDLLNRELQFFVTCLCIGIFTTLTPWIPKIYGLYAGVFAMSVAMGYCDACGQPYSIRLWAGHRFKGPIVQMLYAIWTIGTFFGPLIIGPFLVDLPKDDESNSTTIFCSGNSSISSNCTVKPNTTDSGEYVVPPGMARVRYGYFVAGAIMIGISFSFIGAYFFTRHLKLLEEDEDNDKDKKEEEVKGDKALGEQLPFKVTLLILQLLFAFFIMTSVGIISGLVSTFVIKGLGWSVKHGPYIASAFSGAQAASRLLAIPTSAFIPPVAMLTFNTVLAVLAAGLWTFVETLGHPAVMWTSTIMAGIGLGTTFPQAMLWTSTFMPMTGRVGSFFFVGGSIGIMGGTAFAGYMFENYSHMWVAYLTLVSCIIDLLLFITMFVFVKVYKARFDREKLEITVAVNGTEMQPLKV